jgi:hypothetical protein
MPEGPAPELGEPGEYAAPEFDKRRVAALTQQHAAAGVRRLRKQVQRAISRTYENPNVRRAMVRDALAGYGMGLESVMSGARRSAHSEYSREYAGELDEARVNFQTQEANRMAKFQAAYNIWKAGIGQKQVTDTKYEKLTPEGFEEIGSVDEEESAAKKLVNVGGALIPEEQMMGRSVYYDRKGRMHLM